MRIAVIDMGTNSLRIEVFECKGQVSEKIYRESLMPRLGSGLTETQLLNRNGKLQILQALTNFAKKSRELEVDTYLAVGTSALREAKDAQEFVKEIKNQTEIELEIISGEDEAYLTALGIIANDTNLALYEKKRILVIDVGGGSTELSLYENGEIISPVSVPIGAVKSSQRILDSSPPSKQAVTKLKAEIHKLLSELPSDYLSIPPAIAFCSSGTARTLEKVPFMKGTREGEFTLENLVYFVSHISNLDLRQIEEIPGIDRNRSDIILSGSLILQEVMQYFKIQKFRVSLFSLRHGLLEKIWAASRKS